MPYLGVTSLDALRTMLICRMEEPSIEPPHAKTIALIQDPAGPNKRSAQYLSWHPDGSSKLVIAYSNMNFQVGCVGQLPLRTLHLPMELPDTEFTGFYSSEPV